MKLAVFGAGYVGLVSAAGFAEFGHSVSCVDIDENLIAVLTAGVLPFSEPNLQTLVSQQVEAGRLSFSTDIRKMVSFADVLLIAVGTPPKVDGSADLSAIFELCKSIASEMSEPKNIVVKSTVPPGTCEAIENIFHATLKSRGESIGFSVVSNPEFLREGSAVADFQKPDRLVFGIEKDSDLNVLQSLYRPLMRSKVKIVVTSRESSELTKYAANAMLANRISFINEIAQLAERVGADIESIAEGIGLDKRIGPDYLTAGIGFGGSCFPKDLRALASLGDEHQLPMRIVRATLDVNNEMVGDLILKAERYFGKLNDLNCAVWGMSFKPGTDDIRESRSIDVIRRLIALGSKVRAYDPVVKSLPKTIVEDGSGFSIAPSAYEAIENADAVFLLTDWHEFASPDFHRMLREMTQPVIFDGRNLWNPQILESRGFKYFGIGRED